MFCSECGKITFEPKNEKRERCKCNFKNISVEEYFRGYLESEVIELSRVTDRKSIIIDIINEAKEEKIKLGYHDINEYLQDILEANHDYE